MAFFLADAELVSTLVPLIPILDRLGRGYTVKGARINGL